MVMSVPMPADQAPELPVSWQHSLTSAVHGVSMQVSRANVLKVRAVLLGEAERLLGSVRSAKFRQGWIGQCGGDPVSIEAAAAFDARIRLVVDQCQRYALELKRAGTALDRIARDYGYTEAQISESFSSASPGAAG